MPSARAAVIRGRKDQRKSRQGCGNCKLRKVKCDETKPKCKRCMAYGVFCNYDEKYSDLQLAADGAFKVDVIQGMSGAVKNRTASLFKTILTAVSPQAQYLAQRFSSPLTELHLTPPTPIMRMCVSDTESVASYQLKVRDLELVKKFQGRTLFSIANPNNVNVYLGEMVRLGCSHPYLMHALLTMTLMHDRYLSSVKGPLSTSEAFHWFQCVSLFNAKLSGPVFACDRDPIWATSMCLGIISFFYLESQSPDEAWPLAPPSPTDLNWLKMSEAKNEVWKAAGLSSASIFDIPLPNSAPFLPRTKVELDALPSELLTLCSLDHDHENSYRSAAYSLAQIIHSTSVLEIVFGFIPFISHMPPGFPRLLEEKHTAALMLLLYWYSKLCQHPHWWLSSRAWLEGQSICGYLDMHHPSDPGIQSLLLFPSMVFSDFVN